MAKAADDPGTMEFDFGDEALNDPNYEQNAGNEPDGGGDGTQTADTTTDGGSTQQANTANGQAPRSNGAAPTGGEGGAGQQTDASKQQQRAGAPRADKDGNLVDEHGNIVAAAGAERRHYERVQQQGRYIQRLERELADAKKTGDSATALNGEPARLGLNMQETALGLNIVSSFKKDPVQTARFVLQETMKLGHTLQQIVGADAQGNVQGGSLDLQAVRSMIHDAVQPLVGDRQAAQQAAQADDAAKREYEAFIAKHDHATVHDSVIANMLNDDPQMTPEVAYWQLVAYAARNGLDFTQPLAPQVQARRQQANGGQQPAPNGNAQPSSAQHQQPMSMPNGGAPTADMRSDPGYADPDDSWDSIVQTSLRDAGYQR